ncbi:putative type II secretion system protein HxcR [Myxococcaceae bacterium]|nr:putative type II secretion system protein HxcR [Myxococcaceae bacterium]
MGGDPTEAATAGGESTTGAGQIAGLLLRDGAVDAAQMRHVERVRARLASPKPIVPLLLEIGALSPDRLRETLQRHRLELRIGALLVELGQIPESALATALALQGESGDPAPKLGEILVSLGILGAKELAEVLSSQLGVACVSDSELDPDVALLERVSLDVCRRHRFLPIGAEAERVVVAFADPLDKADAAAARAFLGSEISPRIIAASALDEALARLELAERVRADGGAGERTVARTLAEMIDAALRSNATHVHIEIAGSRVRVRLRCDGALHSWRELPEPLARPLLRRIASEAGVAAAEGATHREGALRVHVSGREVEIHAAFLAAGNAENVTLSIVREAPVALAIGSLGLVPSMVRRLEDGPLSSPGSLLLVAGPPHSGRSTTLGAFVAREGFSGSRVVDLGAVVRANGAATLGPGLLDAALRQDPDVISLGTLREPEGLALALRAANSGASVLAAVDAEDAFAALVAVARIAASEGRPLPSLTAALAQRLVRRVCEACAEPSPVHADLLRQLGCTPVDVAGASFRSGRGCSRCNESGVIGRIGVFELHVLDDEGRERLRESAAGLRAEAARLGPATLLEDALLKAARGIVTIEEVARRVPRSTRPRPIAEVERLEGEGR